MRRRNFIIALAAAAAAPRIRPAHAETIRRLGALMDTDATNVEGEKRIAAFRKPTR